MEMNWKSPTAAGVVTLATFAASGHHIVSVVGETNPVYWALAYPIGIDGLIYVGIRALQERRWFSGVVAVLTGAIFSMAFNGHAEGAFAMPKLMIAFSMPVCFLASILIESTGNRTKDEAADETPAPVRTWTNTGRNWVDAGGRKSLKLISSTVRPPIFVQAEVRPVDEKPAVRPADEKPALSSGRGRKAAWDVKGVVALVLDGRTDVEIMLEHPAVSPKTLQRVRRIVKLMGEGVNGMVITGMSPAQTEEIKEAVRVCRAG